MGGGAPGIRDLREVVVTAAMRRRWVRADNRRLRWMLAVAVPLVTVVFVLVASRGPGGPGPEVAFGIGVLVAASGAVALDRIRSANGRRALRVGRTLGVRVGSEGLTVVRDGVAESKGWIEVTGAWEVADHVHVVFTDRGLLPLVIPPELLAPGDAARIVAAAQAGRSRRRNRTATLDGLPPPLPEVESPPRPFGAPLVPAAELPRLDGPVEVDAAEVERLVADARDGLSRRRYRVLLAVVVVALLLPLALGPGWADVTILVSGVVLVVWRVRRALSTQLLRTAARLTPAPVYRVRIGALDNGFALGVDDDVVRIEWHDLAAICVYSGTVVLAAGDTIVLLPRRAFPPGLLESVA